jgi:hypothetical protein
MNKTVARCVFICAVSVWLVLSLAAPWALSDQHNTFLKNFVNHELLAFLGVVVTITLASCTSLHLELNKLEEAEQRRGFEPTRTAIRRSAVSLVTMLIIAVILTVAKPLVLPDDPVKQQIATSLVNGAALLIVLFNVLVLIDLTLAALKLQPRIKS